jgi:hypothetical protein
VGPGVGLDMARKRKKKNNMLSGVHIVVVQPAASHQVILFHRADSSCLKSALKIYIFDTSFETN